MAPIVLVFAILCGVLLWGGLLWFGVRTLFTVLSGWSTLASRYPVSRLPEYWQWTGQTVKVGLVRYRRTMRIAALPDGLYLAESGLLRHPAVCIPWTELRTATPTTVYGRPFVKVGLGMPPDAAVEFPRDLYHAIYLAAPHR